LLKDKFPDIVLWHCLNHRLELAVGNTLNATSGATDLQSFLESLCSLYSQSPKNMRELSDCAHDLHISLKKNRKVFTIRWMASSFRAVSAVKHSFPALAQRFQNASKMKLDKVQKKLDFKDSFPN